MATVISKGTAKGKSSTNTLSKASIAVNKDSMLIVAVVYDDANGHPTSVTYGNRKLKLKISRDAGAIDIGMSVWIAPKIRDDATRDVTVTWSSNIVEKAMLITSVEGINRVSDKKGNNETIATATPTTGVTSTLEDSTLFAMCYFAGEAPEGDIVTLPEIKDNNVWTAATVGQKVGTVGAPPASNVLLQETYLQLTSNVATEGRITNDAARLWSNAILVFRNSFDTLNYFSSGKCVSCSEILWTTNNVNSVVCSCGDTILNPDGTGTAQPNTDQELEDAARLELGAGDFDDIILVEN